MLRCADVKDGRLSFVDHNTVTEDIQRLAGEEKLCVNTDFLGSLTIYNKNKNNFLDVSVIRSGNKLITDLYVKPTDTHQYQPRSQGFLPFFVYGYSGYNTRIQKRQEALGTRLTSIPTCKKG